MQSGGVYVNGVQQRRSDTLIANELLLDGKVIVIRRGRSSFRIVEALSDEEVEYELHTQTA